MVSEFVTRVHSSFELEFWLKLDLISSLSWTRDSNSLVSSWISTNSLIDSTRWIWLEFDLSLSKLGVWWFLLGWLTDFTWIHHRFESNPKDFTVSRDYLRFLTFSGNTPPSGKNWVPWTQFWKPQKYHVQFDFKIIGTFWKQIWTLFDKVKQVRSWKNRNCW